MAVSTKVLPVADAEAVRRAQRFARLALLETEVGRAARTLDAIATRIDEGKPLDEIHRKALRFYASKLGELAKGEG